ncbi:MAG: hypothetical protein WC069_04230 [Candidatus Shapirobacteria bacterium]
MGCKKLGKYLCDKCKDKAGVVGTDYKNKRIEGRIGLFKYHGAIKDLISLLKFEFVSDAKVEIGQIIVDQLKKNYPNILEYWQENKFVIMPVPLHWRRENWRGFNQAEIIANEVGKKINFLTDNKLILRKANTRHQAVSNKIERNNNIKDAFKIVGKVPKNIIIFDDVWTTGNTIRNIIKIIPKNRKIWVLTLASGN